MPAPARPPACYFLPLADLPSLFSSALSPSPAPITALSFFRRTGNHASRICVICEGARQWPANSSWLEGLWSLQISMLPGSFASRSFFATINAAPPRRFPVRGLRVGSYRFDLVYTMELVISISPRASKLAWSAYGFSPTDRPQDDAIEVVWHPPSTWGPPPDPVPSDPRGPPTRPSSARFKSGRMGAGWFHITSLAPSLSRLSG